MAPAFVSARDGRRRRCCWRSPPRRARARAGISASSASRSWLSTNLGLSRFDPRTDTFKNYDTSHGLQADEFNFGTHFKSASGELFFGGINGFNAFYPDRIQLNNRPPPVVLTSLSILNRPAELGRPTFELDALELDHRDSIVSFEFAALDFTAPERNRYRYRLEGFNDEWIELGNRRLVSFTNANQTESVPLDELAREALELVHGAVEERGVEVEIEPGLPVVIGDRLRLREVLQNLLANAVKYLGDQPAPRVRVGVRWTGSERIFYVRDNGMGIDPRYHEKIFGLFERLATAEEGTGIGLALARRIVELHGGRIWVESEGEGHGSTFCFTLPQTPAAAGSAESDVAAAAGDGVLLASDRFQRQSSA